MTNLKSWLEKECLGTGFVTMSPLSVITWEISQIYSSKFHVISKYVILQINNFIINTMLITFVMIRRQNPSKLRVSYVAKQNLKNMDAFDGGNIEQQIELLKKSSNLPKNIPISSCN